MVVVCLNARQLLALHVMLLAHVIALGCKLELVSAEVGCGIAWNAKQSLVYVGYVTKFC